MHTLAFSAERRCAAERSACIPARIHRSLSDNTTPLTDVSDRFTVCAREYVLYDTISERQDLLHVSNGKTFETITCRTFHCQYEISCALAVYVKITEKEAHTE